MSKQAYPYVAECGFCGSGLLRLYRCSHCDGVVAICDECELTWTNIKAVAKNANAKSDGAFPKCPVCDADEADWYYLEPEEIAEHGLGQYVVGESE